MTLTHVSITLSIQEREALRTLANSELRDPREQARYLLRKALGFAADNDQSQPMQNRGALEADPRHTAAAS